MKKTRNGIRTLALLLCAALAALPLGGCRDSAATPSAPDGSESSAPVGVASRTSLAAAA